MLCRETEDVLYLNDLSTDCISQSFHPMKGMLSGKVTRWERPRRQNGTWTSRLEIAGTTLLHVTTHRDEDHIWITHVGECISAEHVEWTDAHTAHSSHVTLANPEPTRRHSCFMDILPRRVVGMQREKGATVLHLFFEDQSEALWYPPPAVQDVVQVGDHVALFNVKVSPHNEKTLITSRSHVEVLKPKTCKRSKKRARSLSPPPMERAQERQHKWECLMCGWRNYPTHSACRWCDRSRRTGPASVFDFGRVHFAPYWTCKQCGHEEWVNQTRGPCWKCGYFKDARRL